MNPNEDIELEDDDEVAKHPDIYDSGVDSTSSSSYSSESSNTSDSSGSEGSDIVPNWIYEPTQQPSPWPTPSPSPPPLGEGEDGSGLIHFGFGSAPSLSGVRSSTSQPHLGESSRSGLLHYGFGSAPELEQGLKSVSLRSTPQRVAPIPSDTEMGRFNRQMMDRRAQVVNTRGMVRNGTDTKFKPQLPVIGEEPEGSVPFPNPPPRIQFHPVLPMIPEEPELSEPARGRTHSRLTPSQSSSVGRPHWRSPSPLSDPRFPPFDPPFLPPPQQSRRPSRPTGPTRPPWYPPGPNQRRRSK